MIIFPILLIIVTTIVLSSQCMNFILNTDETPNGIFLALNSSFCDNPSPSNMSSMWVRFSSIVGTQSTTTTVITSMWDIYVTD
jgi:hypothetical protein